ncbi:hypothetical protein JOE31_001297 [Arthrobacter sp. PvP023]|uniref:hypothetical protein n=1 Tax=Arthrobacter sp. PvP023 TaxID=2806585 RepID=UPI001B6B5D4E|nr:hypothetical protein [Arthrobacter sp. PvP023]MBP1135065.1 hypothetical protein [Arthrobacter sp. PvP023]
MEAVGEFAPNQALRLGRFPDAPFEPATLKRSLRAVPPTDNIGGRSEPDGMFDGGRGRCGVGFPGGC